MGRAHPTEMDAMFQSGALPVLERLVQFTSARHRVLTDNIANLSTPGFKPRDLSVSGFQAALRDAVERRRGRAGGGGPLELADTADVKFGPGALEVQPQAASEGILFHDGNNRDLERLMAHLAENTLTHNAAIELLRSELGTLQMAIRERV